MNRNYDCPPVPANWAETRKTHPAVAAAIHAISDAKRSPESICEAPTPAEWDHVEMAVSEYIAAGDFPPEEGGRYSWGQEAVCLK